MDSAHQGTRRREQILAMYDASQGAYEAALARFEMLRERTEVVSIEYVCGRGKRDEVRAATAQYLAAESALKQAHARLRMNAETLSKWNLSMG